jgi:hypothetical protein
MQIAITPEKIHKSRAFPALFIPKATLPGCTNIPVAIVRLKMRHAAVKDPNNSDLDGAKAKR